jgi:defect-in-organelle-trafficking protein DotB
VVADSDSGSLKFPDEGPRIVDTEVERLMVWCADVKASDITIQTNQPIWIEVFGRLHKATRRFLTAAEVADILNRIYGANGAAQIASGKDIDISYELRPDRKTRYRYRINATGILSDGSDGIQITARTMPEDPPLIENLGVEKEIVDNVAPRQGLVLVTGPTGSGKTTLLASIIRHLAEQPEGHRKILTYEAPIEFVYDNIKAPTTVISQTEIPRHLPSFAAGVRNALRRKPMVILVGESRDPETMSASAEASLTGHLVYSTVHANGVAETVRRMVSIFPGEERQARAIDLMESLRLVVTQTLLRTMDGKRVACREFLVFDEEVRDYMLSKPVEDWPNESRKMIRERGQPMTVAAQKAFDAGKIDERTLRVVVARAKAQDALMARISGEEA